MTFITILEKMPGQIFDDDAEPGVLMAPQICLVSSTRAHPRGTARLCSSGAPPPPRTRGHVRLTGGMGGSASVQKDRGADLLKEQPKWLKAQASRLGLPALMYPACAMHL